MCRSWQKRQFRLSVIDDDDVTVALYNTCIPRHVIRFVARVALEATCTCGLGWRRHVVYTGEGA